MENAYKNTSIETYRVIENEAGELVGCGGYYLNLDQTEARFAWGMIKRDQHLKGYGTAIAEFRVQEIQFNHPSAEITLGTSQHTFEFYMGLGFDVLNIIPSGFAPNLDKYEMKWRAN